MGRAIEWLIAHAESAPDGDGLQWPLSTSDRHRWRWWCHGAPGIALTFLKLYEHTREERHPELARRALRSDRADIRYANLSQCHGLSGLGEIYLEAARVLGERYWHEQAQSIADDLLSLARQDRDGSLSWLVEDPYLATGDLMVGYSGVLHFLLRMSSDGRSANNDRGCAGLPLSLDIDVSANAG